MKLAAAILLAFVWCACAAELRAPRHVILISLDTTRADHIGAYGSDVPTPRIDALAAEGVVFERASAACTTTLPSHVSLMTGRWPIHHGVARNGFVVHENNLMLAEILREAGFRTVGVSAALELSDLLDFPQGFQLWDQDPESYAGHIVGNRDARRAEEITDAVIQRLEDLEDERLFLFVHYVDPHIPYDPPEPFRSVRGEVPEGFVGDFSEVRRGKARHYGEARGMPGSRGVLHGRLDRNLVRRAARQPLGEDVFLARLYAGEVAYMDRHVGRLLAALRVRGLYENAAIVVTADHGETFWEHGDVWGHGLAVYDTTARIPLILRLPGGAYAGQRIPSAVSNVDVMPTLLDLLGLEPPAAVDGRSLLPLLRGEERESRALFTQAPLEGGVGDQAGGDWVNRRKPHSIRKGGWKYVRTPYLDLEELFDLEADPEEQRDLLRDSSRDVRERAGALRGELRRWMESAEPLPSEFFPRKDPDGHAEEDVRRGRMWERLKSLGYVSDEPDETEGGE